MSRFKQRQNVTHCFSFQPLHKKTVFPVGFGNRFLTATYITDFVAYSPLSHCFFAVGCPSREPQQAKQTVGARIIWLCRGEHVLSFFTTLLLSPSAFDFLESPSLPFTTLRIISSTVSCTDLCAVVSYNDVLLLLYGKMSPRLPPSFTLTQIIRSSYIHCIQESRVMYRKGSPST